MAFVLALPERTEGQPRGPGGPAVLRQAVLVALTHQISSAIDAIGKAAEAGVSVAVTVDAVHDARKALKRTRSTLRLLRRALGKKLFTAESQSFAEVGRAMSATRESQVMDEVLHSLSRALKKELKAGTPSPELSSEDAALLPQGGALLPQGGALLPQGGALLPQDAALLPQDGALSSKDAALSSKDAAPSSKDAALSSKDAALLPEDAALSSEAAGLSSEAAPLSSEAAPLSPSDAAPTDYAATVAAAQQAWQAHAQAAGPLSPEVRDHLVQELERALARLNRWTFWGGIRRSLRSGLQRTVKRAQRDWQAAQLPGTAEETATRYHELRKRVKDLYYMSALLHPAQPEFLGDLTAQLDELADVLGDDHDLTTLAERAQAQPEAFGGPAVVKPLLELAVSRQVKLRAAAQPLLGSVLSTKPARLASIVVEGLRDRVE